MQRATRPHGHANSIQGDFPSDWPQPIIANTIDVVAQDLSESVGTLPTFAAAGDSILEESRRNRADKLTKIINYYTYNSRLGTRLVQGADRLMTYGFLPIRVEPDYENHTPYIQLDDPMGSYFYRDRFGNMKAYLRIFNAARRNWHQCSPSTRMLSRRSPSTSGETRATRISNSSASGIRR